jgi:hypothetical protein
MFALLLAITISVSFMRKKKVVKSIGRKPNILSTAKRSNSLLDGEEPVDSGDCYAAYLAVYDGLAVAKGPDDPDNPDEPANPDDTNERRKLNRMKSTKIKKQQVSPYKNLKQRAATAQQVETFKAECASKAVDGGDCATFLSTLILASLKDTDQASFKEKCEIEDPSSGGAGGSGIFTFPLSNLLLFFSLVIVHFSFRF